MDDVRAVMDAVGSERAAIMGANDGSLMAALFAATHPTERARSCSSARRRGSPLRRGTRSAWGPTSRTGLISMVEQTMGARRSHDRRQSQPGRQPRGGRGLGTLPAALREPRDGRGGHADALRDRRSRGAGDDRRAHPDRPPGGQPDRHARAGSGYVAERIEGALRAGAGRRLRPRARGHRCRARRGGEVPHRCTSRASQIVCSRPCSSPTSSTRRSARPSSAIGAGRSSSRSTIGSCARRSTASADRSPSSPATGRCRELRRPRARGETAQRLSRAGAELGLQIRAGLHAGEIERRGDQIVEGIAVHIGARVASLAAPGRGAYVAHGERPRGRVGTHVRRPRNARAQGRARRVAALRGGRRSVG